MGPLHLKCIHGPTELAFKVGPGNHRTLVTNTAPDTFTERELQHHPERDREHSGYHREPNVHDATNPKSTTSSTGTGVFPTAAAIVSVAIAACFAARALCFDVRAS